MKTKTPDQQSPDPVARDIVAELRYEQKFYRTAKRIGLSNTFGTAADEIERLRAENNVRQVAMEIDEAKIKRQAILIEELRAENKAWQNQNLVEQWSKQMTNENTTQSPEQVAKTRHPERKQILYKCDGAHQFCNEMTACNQCPPAIPLRYEDGTFAPLKAFFTLSGSTNDQD